LNQVVSRISQSRDGVELTTDLWRVQAKRAIVAISPTLAGRIRYEPAMPPLRDALTQRMPMGTAIKMMLVYDRPFWREEGMSGFALTDRDVPQLIYDNSPEDGSCGILLGFTEGLPARAWVAASPEARRAEAIRTAVGCFGAQASQPREFIEKSWMDEEFSRGCYAGTMTPGSWTTFGPALRAPVGRIHWAGTETATFWNGYVEGAIQAGERAAEEVLAAMRS
jgi:monoamine oxidase